MKKFILALVAVVTLALPVTAQQLNVGVSARSQYKKPVFDAVLMAPKFKNVILYGQLSAPTLNSRPEWTAAAEVPVADYPHFYFGLDNGLGWYPVDNKYGKGVWVTGFTSWIPIKNGMGLYVMLSNVPSQNATTTQFGVFRQIF